jgi:hypothetical protein
MKAKLLQFIFLNFLNSRLGFTVFLILSFWLASHLIDRITSSNALRGSSNQFDNIGSIDSSYLIGYEPIDVVYTWVYIILYLFLIAYFENFYNVG